MRQADDDPGTLPTGPALSGQSVGSSHRVIALGVNALGHFSSRDGQVDPGQDGRTRPGGQGPLRWLTQRALFAIFFLR